MHARVRFGGLMLREGEPVSEERSRRSHESETQLLLGAFRSRNPDVDRACFGATFSSQSRIQDTNYRTPPETADGGTAHRLARQANPSSGGRVPGAGRPKGGRVRRG